MPELTLEERLQLVNELFLAVGDNERVKQAASPQAHVYWLVRAILRNTTHPCNRKETLVQVLKKSPLWDKIYPFLCNDSYACGRKGCGCGAYVHTDNIGVCKGYHVDYSKAPYPTTKCNCQGYIVKPL